MILLQVSTQTVGLGELTRQLIPMLPWVVMPVLILWGLRTANRKNTAYVDRARQHMDAVEAKLDQLIELNKRNHTDG